MIGSAADGYRGQQSYCPPSRYFKSVYDDSVSASWHNPVTAKDARGKCGLLHFFIPFPNLSPHTGVVSCRTIPFSLVDEGDADGSEALVDW